MDFGEKNQMSMTYEMFSHFWPIWYSHCHPMEENEKKFINKNVEKL